MLRLHGESMEPKLPAGNLILVDRSRTWRQGGTIFVAQAGGEMVVKRTVNGRDGS